MISIRRNFWHIRHDAVLLVFTEKLKHRKYIISSSPHLQTCLKASPNTCILELSGSFTDCSIKRFRVLVLKAISPASILTCSTRRSISSDIVIPPYNLICSQKGDLKRYIRKPLLKKENTVR